jgi:hypothetical protein
MYTNKYSTNEKNILTYTLFHLDGLLVLLVVHDEQVAARRILSLYRYEQFE